MKSKPILAFLLSAIAAANLCACGTITENSPAYKPSDFSEDSTNSGSKEDTKESEELEDDKQEQNNAAKSMAVNILSSYDHIDNDSYNPNSTEWADSIWYLMNLKYEYPEILSGGSIELKESLLKYQQAQEKRIAELKSAADESIAVVPKEDYAGIGIPWANEYTVSIARADESVFSFWENFYYNEGGTHPTYTSRGINYDAQTGKQLSLDDVVTNKEALYQNVINAIYTMKEERDIDDNYISSVRALFYPDKLDDPALVWTLDKEGLCVHFNVYDIAPYSSGAIDVVIPYDECGEFIKEQYINNTESNVKAVPEYSYIYFDADGDGTDEELYIDVKTSEEQNGFVLTVKYGESGNIKSIEKEAYIRYDKSFLMKNENGKYYLYVQAVENNDLSYLMVFDLSDPQAGPVEIEMNLPDSFSSFEPTDAEHLYLSRRILALGTRSGYREFKIGDDGIPVAKQDAYSILNWRGMEYSLTAKQEIQGEDGTIANGESCAVISAAVDNKGDVVSVVLQTKDFKCLTLKMDPKTELSYGETIDGAKVTDLFDGIVYAG